jgi:hypothetical protein
VLAGEFDAFLRAYSTQRPKDHQAEKARQPASSTNIAFGIQILQL